MKISRSRLRRIIREERSRLIQEQSSTEMDAADIQLSIAIELFGPETLVDEEMGEIIIDVGDDQLVEDMYDQWVSYWPEGQMEEDGRIYTGIHV
jgi:hypothetical protein